jgi:hypothetical protein
MITNQTRLFDQLHKYVDEYIDYMNTGAEHGAIEATDQLRRVVHELEALQANPNQPADAIRLEQTINVSLDHLRTLAQQERRAPVSRPKRTLAQAFRDYLSEEVDYLSRAGGALHREQANLLISDIIADLKALSLRPDDDQALQLAADIEAKREQLNKLQRPWQRAARFH